MAWYNNFKGSPGPRMVQHAQQTPYQKGPIAQLRDKAIGAALSKGLSTAAGSVGGPWGALVGSLFNDGEDYVGEKKYAQGKDTVPAKLTPGEAVIPAPAAQDPQFKPLIDLMIAEGRKDNKKHNKQKWWDKEGIKDLEADLNPKVKGALGVLGGLGQTYNQGLDLNVLPGGGVLNIDPKNQKVSADWRWKFNNGWGGSLSDIINSWNLSNAQSQIDQGHATGWGEGDYEIAVPEPVNIPEAPIEAPVEAVEAVEAAPEVESTPVETAPVVEAPIAAPLVAPKPKAKKKKQRRGGGGDPRANRHQVPIDESGKFSGSFSSDIPLTPLQQFSNVLGAKAQRPSVDVRTLPPEEKAKLEAMMQKALSQGFRPLNMGSPFVEYNSGTNKVPWWKRAAQYAWGKGRAGERAKNFTSGKGYNEGTSHVKGHGKHLTKGHMEAEKLHKIGESMAGPLASVKHVQKSKDQSKEYEMKYHNPKENTHKPSPSSGGE